MRGVAAAPCFLQRTGYICHWAENKTESEAEESEVIKLSIVNGSKTHVITAEGLHEGNVNYFIGNNLSKWKTDIPTFSSVLYKEVYEGIDLRFYGNNRKLEYDVIVKPGHKPEVVSLSYEGIEDLQVTGDGKLEITLKTGKLIQEKPYIYQEIDGVKVEVEGGFKIENPKPKESPLPTEGRNPEFPYSFRVASYDKSRPLIIDPTIEYSTYLGGSGSDVGISIAVDSSGNAYVTGQTTFSGFPTVNPFDGSYNGGGGDAFVTKINPAGSSLVYSTYLGGSNRDFGNSIAVDTSGNAYVTGNTDSPDFPTVNPFAGSLDGFGLDAFVTKIDAGSMADPMPDIKANGLDGPLSLIDNLLVTVALDPASRSGYNADWWVAVDTPFGWYYYNLSTFSFVFAGTSPFDILVTFQGPLFNLSPPFEVFNMSGLPSGTYIFYFAVDLVVNGVLDFDSMSVDSVIVVVP